MFSTKMLGHFKLGLWRENRVFFFFNKMSRHFQPRDKAIHVVTKPGNLGQNVMFN